MSVPGTGLMSTLLKQILLQLPQALVASCHFTTAYCHALFPRHCICYKMYHASPLLQQGVSLSEAELQQALTQIFVCGAIRPCFGGERWTVLPSVPLLQSLTLQALCSSMWEIVQHGLLIPSRPNRPCGSMRPPLCACVWGPHVAGL
jgi:hypothetical protein